MHGALWDAQSMECSAAQREVIIKGKANGNFSP